MSKSTDRIIRIKAEDDVTSQVLTIVRTMRSLATAIRQVRTLMVLLNQMQKVEAVQTMALAGAYRYLALMKTAASMIGVGAALVAVAASFAMLGSGAAPVPIAQTSAGTSRRVSATGLAVVHADEMISKGAQTGGRGGGDINITIHSADMSYRAGIEETVAKVGTLIYQGYRRLRH